MLTKKDDKDKKPAEISIAERLSQAKNASSSDTDGRKSQKLTDQKVVENLTPVLALIEKHRSGYKRQNDPANDASTDQKAIQTYAEAYRAAMAVISLLDKSFKMPDVVIVDLSQNPIARKAQPLATARALKAVLENIYELLVKIAGDVSNTQSK